MCFFLSVTRNSAHFSRGSLMSAAQRKITGFCVSHTIPFLKQTRIEVCCFASVTVLTCHWLPPSDPFLGILMIFSCIVNFNVHVLCTLKTCLSFNFRLCRKGFWWIWRKYLYCRWKYRVFLLYLIFSWATSETWMRGLHSNYIRTLLYSFIYSKLAKRKKKWNVL